MYSPLLPLLLASMLTGCACGTETLRPAPVRCDPSLMVPGPETLAQLPGDKATAGDVVAAHHADAAEYARQRQRLIGLADCVRAHNAGAGD